MKRNRVVFISVAIPIVSVCIALIFIIVKQSLNSSNNMFPVNSYIEHPRNFSGNSYILSASIVSQLAYSDTKGRILLVKSQSKNTQIPLYISPTIKNFNPQVNQIYMFEVKVDSEGKLIMTDFRKL